MSTQETYELDGSTRFDFPHPVRDPQQLTVEVRPGNVVPSSDYEVVGYGPNATGVTVYYPDAPSDPDLELRITRYTEPERVTRFSDGTPVQPKALDAEFDNLFQLYVDMPNYVQLAEDWASEEEDTEVSDGKYSAFHWAQKSQEWAENLEGEETYDGGYSAFHWAQKAQEWAENDEGEETYDGGYSAKHYSKKAEKQYQNTLDISRHYLGVLESDPSENPVDGSDLENGDFYFNRDDETLRFYDGSDWYYNGNLNAGTAPDSVPTNRLQEIVRQERVLSRDHTISSSTNGFSAGPTVEIPDDIEVTIEEGGYWTVGVE